MSIQETGAIPDDNLTQETKATTDKSRVYIIVALIVLVALVTGLVFAVIAMVNNPLQTETIRDIMIIFMAVESLLIGLILILLIYQLARLTTLLETEIRPILESTNETVNNLRGTTAFLSNNLVRPVIKANSSFSAIRQALNVLGLFRSNSGNDNGGRKNNV
jgi:hypothetical protein